MVKPKKRIRASTRPTASKLPGAAKIRELAVAAEVDPKTVKKELLAPGSCKGMAGDRIRKALESGEVVL